MAIEAVAAVAAKEVAVQAAREAVTQAAQEIAQKMATEAGTQGAGNELQTAMMERQTMQDGFRVGEMSEGKGEGREFLKQKEADAAEELRGKLDTEEVRPETENTPINESPEVQNPAETEVTEANAAQEVAESPETVESNELARAQDGANVEKSAKPTWEDYLSKDSSSRKPVFEGLQCGKDVELLNGQLPANSVLEIDNPNGKNHIHVETNGRGRNIEQRVDRIERTPVERDAYQQRRCCQIKDGKSGDDGGHLLAAEHGGPKEQFNLLPMNSYINRHGEWRRMERFIERALDGGKEVTDWRVRSYFQGESLRPENLNVSMKIDGIPKHFHIKNPAMVA